MLFHSLLLSGLDSTVWLVSKELFTCYYTEAVIIHYNILSSYSSVVYLVTLLITHTVCQMTGWLWIMHWNGCGSSHGLNQPL